MNNWSSPINDKTCRGYRFADPTSSTASSTNEWLFGIGAVADLQTRLSQQTEASALAVAASVQPLAPQCFQLSNMFNPQIEEEVGWDTEIKDDVIEECNKHGGVIHIYVAKNSAQGNVYVKCPSIPAAIAAVSALHGRWFAASK